MNTQDITDIYYSGVTPMTGTSYYFDTGDTNTQDVTDYQSIYIVPNNLTYYPDTGDTNTQDITNYQSVFIAPMG